MASNYDVYPDITNSSNKLDGYITIIDQPSRRVYRSVDGKYYQTLILPPDIDNNMNGIMANDTLLINSRQQLLQSGENWTELELIG